MIAALEVALPVWLDRPDEKAVEITLAAEHAWHRDRIGR